MIRIKVLKIIAASILMNCAALAQVPNKSDRLERYHFDRGALGTMIALTLYHDDSSGAEEIAHLAFQYLDSLNQVLSDYLPTSEVGRINTSKDKTHSLSPILLEVLTSANVLTKNTSGVFDVYLGRLTHLWKRAFGKNRFPGKRRIRRAMRKSGHQSIELDTVQAKLHRLKPVHIDLGGIGKGFIGDKLGKFLKASGVSCFLLDLGGDLIAGDAPPGAQGWLIEVPGIEPQLIVNQSIATSGGVYQYVTHRGTRYSHLINPRTGLGLQKRVTATAICDDATTADALASALPFLRKPRLEGIAHLYPGLHFIIQTGSGEIRSQ